MQIGNIRKNVHIKIRKKINFKTESINRDTEVQFHNNKWSTHQ